MFAADHSVFTGQADRDVRADHVPRHEISFPAAAPRGRLPAVRRCRARSSDVRARTGSESRSPAFAAIPPAATASDERTSW